MSEQSEIDQIRLERERLALERERLEFERLKAAQVRRATQQRAIDVGKKTVSAVVDTASNTFTAEKISKVSDVLGLCLLGFLMVVCGGSLLWWSLTQMISFNPFDFKFEVWLFGAGAFGLWLVCHPFSWLPDEKKEREKA